ncbi:glycosyltransferase [Marinobacter nauticus]|nr:glycosyltransferase [Marinobacter nauticus]
MHIINTVFGDARGGRWQVLIDYSRWLREAGHKVTVIIGTKAKEPTSELELLGCHILRIRNSGFYDPGATIMLWLILRKLRPDAIISHGGRSTCLFRRAKPKGTPLIAVNHSNNVKRSIGADIYFNISDHIEQLIRGRTRQGLHFRVINCPRELTVHPPRPDTRDATRLSSMGQLIPRKGIDVLLHSLSRLDTRGVPFTCAIAGTGPQKDELELLCKQLELQDKVQFVGHIRQPIEFLANSDIFCFPTKGEGFPISPIEAFAAGCAVVGTDDPGTAELLEHGNLGMVVPRGDIDGLEQALETLILNPEKRLELAKKAQHRYLQQYTPVKAKAGFLDALESAIHQFQRLDN